MDGLVGLSTRERMEVDPTYERFLKSPRLNAKKDVAALVERMSIAVKESIRLDLDTRHSALGIWTCPNSKSNFAIGSHSDAGDEFG